MAVAPQTGWAAAGWWAAEGAAQLARDAVAGVLTLPLRGVFILLSKLGRLARAVRGEKQLPKMK